MRITIFILAGFSIFNSPLRAQTRDSIKRLDEVLVQGYLTDQNLLKTPSAASIVDLSWIKKQAGNSFVPVFNTVPGIRMEERSPGSYRLSIRGSLLRSPFGIRNVKVYMDEFPLTDCGGNTYLNLLDINSIGEIEILKGPDGSLFGANSGGVILLKTLRKTSDSLSAFAELHGGTFGLFRQSAQIEKQGKQYQLKLNEAWQRSDGYRDNSSLNRKYIQASHRWSYNPRNEFRSVAFYSDLHYLTPGGLTNAQFQNDPRSARPATPFLPGAVEQKAGIGNKTLFGGLLHEAKITERLKHLVAIFGSHTDFQNPFISNFEVRDESNFGYRSYLEFTSKGSGFIVPKIQIGLEAQQNKSAIVNYGNRGGIKDTLQSSDKIKANQNFYFTRFSAEISERFIFETAVSLNYFKYRFDPNQVVQNQTTRKFDPQLMPRVALSYLSNRNITLRSSVSRGFSPPTLSEIRSSNQLINTALQAESGWNYETGVRLRNNNDRFWLDASFFYYRLQNAIVRRVNADDTEFFLNAGGTRQFGFESQISAWLLAPGRYGLLRGIQFRNSLSLSNFKFRDYQSGTEVYSGNRLTGVPDQVIVTSVDITLPGSVAFFIQHNYTSKIPLNDANTDYSEDYNLIQLKASWRNRLKSKPEIELFAGVDNLLNQKYSLGNDLNAFGGRYYNAAAIRNFFGGIKAAF